MSTVRGGGTIGDYNQHVKRGMATLVRRLSIGVPVRFFSSSASGVRVLLRRRPSPGEPVSDSCFELREGGCGPPAAICAAGSLAHNASDSLYCRTLFVSVDPYLRCRFNESTGVAYTQPYGLGEVITSAGIGEVLACGAAAAKRGFAAGDLVLQPFDSWPWATAASVPASSVSRIPPSLGMLIAPSALLGAAGQPGLTAMCGVEHVAQPQPGESVVVSGAAGAVGSIACQLFRQRGCRVIGLAGSDEKMSWLLREGVVDVALNYKHPELSQHLADAAPVHVYWDNVGGRTSDAVITSALAPGARILMCGQIAMYDHDEPYPPPLPPTVQEHATRLGITRTRYLVLDHQEYFGRALAELCRLVASGELVGAETKWEGGVGRAPTAFLGMMDGANIGKALVAAGAHAQHLPMRSWQVAEAMRGALPASLRGALARRFVTPEQFSTAL